MSVRYLYRTVPEEERICQGCGKPIIKNIESYRGQIYHHGCRMDEQDKRFRCPDCHAVQSGVETVWATFQPDPRRVRCCGYCGSPNLTSGGAWWRP